MFVTEQLIKRGFHTVFRLDGKDPDSVCFRSFYEFTDIRKTFRKEVLRNDQNDQFKGIIRDGRSVIRLRNKNTAVIYSKDTGSDRMKHLLILFTAHQEYTVFVNSSGFNKIIFDDFIAIGILVYIFHILIPFSICVNVVCFRQCVSSYFSKR